MKTHVQEPGVRPWFGDDFTELQSEPLKAIGALLNAIGQSFIVTGCAISKEGSQLAMDAGYICFHSSAQSHIASITQPIIATITHGKVWLVPLELEVKRNYGDGVEKTAVRIKTAELTNSDSAPAASAILVYDSSNAAYQPPNLAYFMVAPAEATSSRALRLDAQGLVPKAAIPSLDAEKITSGVLNVDRIPELPASKTTSGTFDTERIPTLEIDKINGLAEALINRPTREIMRDQVIVEVVERIDNRIEALRPEVDYKNPNIVQIIEDNISGRNLPSKDYVENIITNNVVNRIDDRIKALRPEEDYKNDKVKQELDLEVEELHLSKIPGLQESLDERPTREALRDQVIVEVTERIDQRIETLRPEVDYKNPNIVAIINDNIQNRDLPTKDFVNNAVTGSVVSKIDERIEALRPDGANLELQIIGKIEQLRPENEYKNTSIEQLKTALKQAGLVDSADVNTAINAKIPEVETLLSGVDAEITALNTALSQANTKINTLETFKATIDNNQIITKVQSLEANVTNLESNIAVNQNFRDNIKAAILSDRDFFKDALNDPTV